ncbi:GNAT family N-acetyltransferase [Vibrio mangrovi]|uniref:Acetyltransferase (GNAT) family protein n=1 Tax=Vibrio mangrovi TaxID=474394 RepID=A0A1Y6IUY7_9VIBR|nr:GNAT family N-acetyltransferase [Vibrio mangrovi]MDW6003357.1 GNAT family N-acetyltransferase [Vibrio mangrovi]SMR99853.1 Acetyltransferase (GNAT) family protein [Vibrio mangrovi]
MTIATQRMLLLPYTDVYEFDFLSLLCSPGNRFFHQQPFSVSSARAQFHHVLADSNIYAMAVVDNECREYMGHLALDLHDKDVGELQFILNRLYWGRGYATEALKAFLQNVSLRFTLKKIRIFVNAQNQPAVALMRKLGFISRSVSPETPEILYEYELTAGEPEQKIWQV